MIPKRVSKEVQFLSHFAEGRDTVSAEVELAIFSTVNFSTELLHDFL